jgi:hypothetical protein
MPSTVKNKKANMVFPSDVHMSTSNVVSAIREAEKGPFYTSAEVKQHLKKWSKKYSR